MKKLLSLIFIFIASTVFSSLQENIEKETWIRSEKIVAASDTEVKLINPSFFDFQEELVVRLAGEIIIRENGKETTILSKGTFHFPEGVDLNTPLSLKIQGGPLFPLQAADLPSSWKSFAFQVGKGELLQNNKILVHSELVEFKGNVEEETENSQRTLIDITLKDLMLTDYAGQKFAKLCPEGDFCFNPVEMGKINASLQVKANLPNDKGRAKILDGGTEALKKLIADNKYSIELKGSGNNLLSRSQGNMTTNIVMNNQLPQVNIKYQAEAILSEVYSSYLKRVVLSQPELKEKEKELMAVFPNIHRLGKISLNLDSTIDLDEAFSLSNVTYNTLLQTEKNDFGININGYVSDIDLQQQLCKGIATVKIQNYEKTVHDSLELYNKFASILQNEFPMLIVLPPEQEAAGLQFLRMISTNPESESKDLEIKIDYSDCRNVMLGPIPLSSFF